jgi:hypothetical protein
VMMRKLAFLCQILKIILFTALMRTENGWSQFSNGVDLFNNSLWRPVARVETDWEEKDDN